jgi:hypothetical protein
VWGSPGLVFDLLSASYAQAISSPFQKTSKRQNRAAKGFAVAIEIITGGTLDEQLAVAMLRVLGAKSSPLCAACRNTLLPSEPPAGWMLFRRLDTGARTLAAVYTACSQREPGDLVARAATLAGLTLRVVHPQWGRA